MIIARSFFFLRNLNFLFPSLGFNFLLSSLRDAFRDIVSFLVPMFVIMYTFAVVGMSIFGGLINKSLDKNQYEVNLS